MNIKPLTHALISLLAFMFLLDATTAHAQEDICWKKSYGRGVGTIPTQCPSGQENDAGLCYPKCKKGYKGVGPVCWQSCPSGFTDTGGHCLKPKAYGRGTGFAWKPKDGFKKKGMLKRCERRHGKKKCQMHGAIAYPRCKAGYKPAGCCVCSPICPKGMTDIGVSCQKKSYGRGVGKIPKTCKGGKVNDAGLCYPKCDTKTNGVGPVCWAKQCPADYPVNCGAACAKSSAQCAAAVINQVTSTGEVALNVGMLVTTGGAANAGFKAARTAGKVAARSGRGLFKAGSAAHKAAKRAYKAKLMRSSAYQRLKKVHRLAELNDKIELAASAFATAKGEGEFDFTTLDPTGVSAAVMAFNKPMCHMAQPRPVVHRHHTPAHRPTTTPTRRPTPPAPPRVTPRTARDQLQNVHSGRCVVHNQKNRLMAKHCKEKRNRRWKIDYKGNNSWHVRSMETNKCLFTSTGGQIGMYTCNLKYRDQIWVRIQRKGTFMLKNTVSNKCLFASRDGRFGTTTCNTKYADQWWRHTR